MTGVELDPTTAAIAAALHPHATIRQESFAETAAPEGSFDLVIGNVPFGDVVLHDRRHNIPGHRIHNHFIVKSLHLTRPGGLVAVLTSRYTMGATNPSARREIASLADLVGAVRFPTGAHRRSARTDVVTDLLILRRREDGVEARGAGFERALPAPLDGAGEELRVNEYFFEHPEHVLGALSATQGDRGRPELGVEGDRNAATALGAALDAIVAHARQFELTLSDRDVIGPRAVARLAGSERRPEGFLRAVDGQFTRMEQGAEVPYEPPASQVHERTHSPDRIYPRARVIAQATYLDGAIDPDEVCAVLSENGY